MRTISLSQGMVAIVDDEDYSELITHKWFAIKQGSGIWYAARNSPWVKGKHRLIRMHREIIGTPNGMDTDHINGNGLDNRRENLRVVTHRVNTQNRHQNKSSKYPGVVKDCQSGKWIAQIRVNGIRRYLGRFETEEVAANAYVSACVGVAP